jgi:hypothetical protein
MSSATVTSAARRRLPLILFILVSLCLTSSPAFASVAFEPVFNPTLKITKAVGEINIDGDISDPGWLQAAQTTRFVERHPGENLPPELTTRVFVTFDRDKLYVAFVCLDDPAQIRASMCQRDQFFNDDEVTVFIDTYGDAAWAYQLHVNPYGVQKDQLWSTVTGSDIGYNLVWESAAQITDSGYTVELAVPFSSMRFPSKNIQQWKMDFWREHPRSVYREYSWAAYDRNDQCWACQWGTVEGIADVEPGKGVEILPSFVGMQSGYRDFQTDPNATLDMNDWEGEMSIAGKYSLSSDMTVEGTLNPDFSQIEADAAQIDVNTTIALFYPERRPFFQEGSDLFRTLFNSFYTRTVNDPQYAAKFTGRFTGGRIGFLSALDENTPYMIPLEQSSQVVNTGKSAVNVLRGSKTVGANSQLGFMLTDRRLDGGGSGSIASFDGNIRLNRNFNIDGQFLWSHTAEPDQAGNTAYLDGVTFDNGKHTAVFDGESFSGIAFISRLRRNARHLNFIADFNQVSPSYRTETGYDPTMDYRNGSFWTWYHIRPSNGLFHRITPQANVQKRWGFDGEKRFENFNAQLESQLRFAQTYLSVRYYLGSEMYRGKDFKGLRQIDFDVNMRPSDLVAGGVSFEFGKAIARFQLVRGNETNIFAWLNLKPIDRIRIEPNVNWVKSTHEETGEVLYKGYITRTRLQYQANKELSLRLVVQYNDFGRAWDVDPLLTYRLGSFTVLYLGSTMDYTDISAQQNSVWKMTSRQFFMKIQYLFQT